MKKLLVLCIILIMVSGSPAALQISVEGNPDPVDSEIGIAQDQELILGIHGDVPAGYIVNWLMMVDETMGTLFYDDGIGPYYYPHYYLPLYYPGYSLAYGYIGGLEPLSGVLVDIIEYHAESYGDAIVQLYSSSDTVVWTLEDVVVIHQLPEPVTIALLSFGGLYIRKR